MSNESQWSSASGDAGNVLSGTPLGDLLSGNGAAAGFSIDYERVPQAITDLRHAAEFFESRARIAEGLAKIPAPGTDGVSIYSVEQLGKWASDSGENNLTATLKAGASEFKELAHKLEEDLKAYLQVEALNLPKGSHRRVTAVKTNLVIATIAGALTLAGCGASTSAGLPLSRSTSTAAANPIPPIKNPRDVAALAGRPCEMLTAQQAKEFGLDLPPRRYNFILGTIGCQWKTTSRSQESIRTVDVTTFTNNPTLEVAYSKDRSLPFFQLTDIAEYPAITTRTNADLPICDIDVEPAERQSFTLTYQSQDFKSDPQQSCEVGKQVAAAVLMNLPLKS